MTLELGAGGAWLTGGTTCRFGVCGLLNGAGLATGRGGSDGWREAPVRGAVIGAAGRGIGATGCDVAGIGADANVDGCELGGGCDDEDSCDGAGLILDSGGAGLDGIGAAALPSCLFRISILTSLCLMRFEKSFNSPGL